MKKTYFLAPNFDYPPNGSLSLGRILSDPTDPGSCIDPDGQPPFPDNMQPRHVEKTDWKSERFRERGGLIGLWARFLQVVGVDAEASVNWSRTQDSVYSFAKLDTDTIDPTKEYVAQCVTTLLVAAFIIESNYKKPVYMITGVKTARGADAAFGKSRTMGANSQFGVVGTSTGAPAAGGPKMSFHTSDSEKTSFGGSADFVFAYRLREIFYEKGQVKHKEYNRGALYNTSVSSEETQAQHCKPESFLKVVGIARSDAADGLGDKSKDVGLDDGDEECFVIVRK